MKGSSKPVSNRQQSRTTSTGKNIKSGAERRAHQRLPYEVDQVMVTVLHPGGTISSFLVSCRDLSVGGMSFMHRGFLYDGTHCKVHLPTLSGEEHTVCGRITRCLHRSGGMHEIGVCFSHEIDPRHFMNVGVEYAEINAVPMEMPDLCGRILSICSDAVESGLLEHHLKGTGINVIRCKDPRRASTVTRMEPFDLIVCDLVLSGVTGEEIIAELRTTGYKGAIVALSADRSSTRLKRAKQMGATEVLLKPYSPAVLLRLLSSLMKSCTSVKCDEPIYSTFSGRNNMVGLVSEFLDSLSEYTDVIITAMEEDDVKSALDMCMRLQGCGASYGFPILSEVASTAVQSLESALTTKDATANLRRLLGTCSRLRLAEAG